MVVDDDNDVLYTARLVLRGLFEKVDTLDRPGLIPEYLKTSSYDLILLDMNYSRGTTSGKEGLQWLEKILSIDPAACVLTTTAYGEINLAVQAMKKGATDFITKPWNREQLIASVNNVLSLKHEERNISRKKGGQARSSNQENNKYHEIISRSPVMAQIKKQLKL